MKEKKMTEIVKKQVCKCENCGNEAEMMITCTLPDEDDKKKETPKPSAPADQTQKVKGKGTCTHCGNEADMWIDL